MRTLAQWCVRHRRIVLGAWVTGLIAIIVAVSSVGTGYRNSFSLNGTQSYEAQQLLQKAAPKAAGDREQIVFAVRDGKVTDPAARAQIEAVLHRVEQLPEVAEIQSPFSKEGAAQISRSGEIAFADVTLTKLATAFSVTQAKHFVDTATAGAGDGLRVAVGGAVAEASQTPKDTSAGIGALAALAVLLVVFGSVLAAILPLVTAGFALGVGVSAIGLLSNVLTMANFSSELSVLIGLGVGVDYALFIVSRHRQGLLRGVSVETSIVDAVDTSGRAVMFAGLTVCIALLGMFALGVSFLYGVAVAAATVVAFTVLAALTLLPALLGFMGLRVLGRRARASLLEQHAAPVARDGFWVRWTTLLSARPALFAVIGVLFMGLLAIPFFSMRLGSSDAGSDPAGSTTRQAYDLLAEGFGPGYNGPLQLVAEVGSPEQERAFAQTVDAAARTPGVVSVSPTIVLPGATGEPGVAFANVYATGSPQSASTGDLLDTLRDDVVPAHAAGSGVRVLIGGQTAIFSDFASVLSSKLPLFIGIVVLLSFLLLSAVFRSLVIPFMAALMNMLSAGAAFGLITAVFQWGWAASLFGIDRTGPIEAFVPVMMFAILFGLSMDYEVFLVSRIYEEWHRTRDNRLAVTLGLRETGRTITAAATIMVLVFGAFLLGDQVVIKMFGLGLAGAILMDALVVRMMLVPALMLLVGPRNWWLPGWLDRILPRLNVEGSVQHEPHRHPSAHRAAPAGAARPAPAAE